MSDTQYPLNNKLERVSDLTHAIASFLEWAEKQKKLSLCEPYNRSIHGMSLSLPARNNF